MESRGGLGGTVREEQGGIEKIREEKVRRKKVQAREKVEKSRNTVFSNDLWLQRVEKYAR